MIHYSTPSSFMIPSRMIEAESGKLLAALQQKSRHVFDCLRSNESLLSHCIVYHPQPQEINSNVESSFNCHCDADNAQKGLQLMLDRVRANDDKILRLTNSNWQMKRLILESKKWINKNQSGKLLPIVNNERALEQRQLNRRIRQLMRQLSQKIDILERKRTISSLQRAVKTQPKSNEVDEALMQKKANRICHASEKLLMRVRQFLSDQPQREQSSDYDI